MAVASTSHHRREENLIEPFIETLRLERPITIPADTLLGAVTHFLSTLPNRHVSRLIVALAESPSLWNGDVSADRIRDAIALSVESKVDKLQTRRRKSWLQARRTSQDARAWLSGILDSFTSVSSSKDTQKLRTTHMSLGLLKGVQAVDLDWTRERVSLEESVVLSLAQVLENSVPDRATLEMLCEAVCYLDLERVSVLDPSTVLPLIEGALFAALDNGTEPQSQITAYSSAIARLFSIIAEGIDDRSPTSVLAPMIDFVTAFQDRAERIEEQRDRMVKGKGTEKESRRHTICHAAFLTPASSVVDILLARPELMLAVDSTHKIPMTVIETLSAFSSINDNAEDRPRDFDRVLYSSLDLLTSSGDSMAIRQLFVKLHRDQMTPSRAAFTLKCGQLLVNKLDRPTAADMLLPLADRTLHDKEHQESFVAGHDFMFAVIRSAGNTDIRPVPQEAFILEILPYYSRILLRHFKRAWISSETFTESYLALLQTGSKVDDRLVDDLISLLMHLDGSESPVNHTLLATSTAASQYIPRRRLRAHLEDIGSRIDILPVGENRLDLAAKVFTTISQELRDDTRGVGMTWWWEWKDTLLGRSQDERLVRAKL